MVGEQVTGIVNISIPAPARGRTEEAKEKAVLFEFQFPPPRGGERDDI